MEKLGVFDKVKIRQTFAHIEFAEWIHGLVGEKEEAQTIRAARYHEKLFFNFNKGI